MTRLRAPRGCLAAVATLTALCACQKSSPPVVKAPPLKEATSSTPRPAKFPPAADTTLTDVCTLGKSGKTTTAHLPLAVLTTSDDVVFDEATKLFFTSVNWSEARAVTLSSYDGAGKLAAVTELPEPEWLMSFFALYQGKPAIASYDEHSERSLWSYTAEDDTFHADPSAVFSDSTDDAFNLTEAKARRKVLAEIRPPFPIPMGGGTDRQGHHGSVATNPEVWYADYPVLTGRPDLPRVDFSPDRTTMAMANAHGLVALRSGPKTWRNMNLRPSIAATLGIKSAEIILFEVQIRGGVIAFGFRIAGRPSIYRTALCRPVNNGYHITIVKARFVRSL